MKQALRPICLAAAMGLAALAPVAVADPDEDCRQMAAEEAVPVEDLEDYIAECVAMLENDYPDEAEGTEEFIPETEAPDGGGAPVQQ
jgi:hypothetical protein